MTKSLGLFVRGALMGTADLIPGVSGGTMALLTGIYQPLLASLSQLLPALILFLRLKPIQSLQSINWLFLIPVLCGALLSIVSLSHIITWLLDNTRDWLLAFFLGLVLITALTLMRRSGSITWRTTIFFAMGCALSLVLNYLPAVAAQPGLLIFYLSGAFAICAMLLPGISGSLLLLLIGMYQPVLDSLRNFDLVTIFVFALGALTGLLFFSRVLFLVYHNHRAVTLAFLAGLTLSSAMALWPQQQIQFNLLLSQPILHWSLLVLLIFCGFICGWYLSHVDKASQADKK